MLEPILQSAGIGIVAIGLKVVQETGDVDKKQA